MTKLEILNAQIQTDIKELEKDIEVGMATDDITKELKRINEKIKEWSKEANRIMDEAKAIDSKAKGERDEIEFEDDEETKEPSSFWIRNIVFEDDIEMDKSGTIRRDLVTRAGWR